MTASKTAHLCATRRAGFSLFEALIVLALFSLLAGLSVGAMRPGQSSLHLRQAAAQLTSDLKRAKLEAATSAAPVTVKAAPNGYAIEALGVSQELPDRLSLSYTTEELIFTLDALASYERFTLTDAKGAAHVDIAPLTGEITLHMP
ncbi:MAG: prepilin-type N-terminal cleavage/methylation domain-containing protein [Pseudomonadota bacterium]